MHAWLMLAARRRRRAAARGPAAAGEHQELHRRTDRQRRRRRTLIRADREAAEIGEELVRALRVGREDREVAVVAQREQPSSARAPAHRTRCRAGRRRRSSPRPGADRRCRRDRRSSARACPPWRRSCPGRAIRRSAFIGPIAGGLLHAVRRQRRQRAIDVEALDAEAVVRDARRGAALAPARSPGTAARRPSAAASSRPDGRAPACRTGPGRSRSNASRSATASPMWLIAAHAQRRRPAWANRRGARRGASARPGSESSRWRRLMAVMTRIIIEPAA